MRKRADEALRMSENRYRHLFDSASEGIFQTTPEGKLISVNSAFARVFGVELQGGHILVASAFGKGNRFAFDMPIRQARGKKESSSETIPEGGMNRPSLRGKGRKT